MVLHTDDPAEVRQLAAFVSQCDDDARERLHLEPATVTRVETAGVGDRVCVDMCVPKLHSIRNADCKLTKAVIASMHKASQFATISRLCFFPSFLVASRNAINSVTPSRCP